jgi:hypothetical protein
MMVGHDKVFDARACSDSSDLMVWLLKGQIYVLASSAVRGICPNVVSRVHLSLDCDSPGCADHGAGLGLFGEPLEDEIRLDKNPIVGW